MEIVPGSHVPSHFFDIDTKKYTSMCTCGWLGLNKSKSAKGAREAWDAHIYAKGFRTAAQVRIVCTPVKEKEVVENG